MKLTKEQIQKMLPGQTIICKCDDIGEFNSTLQIAYKARRNCPREDDCEYKIEQSVGNSEIRISLIKHAQS